MADKDKDITPADQRKENQGSGGDKGIGPNTNTGRPSDAEKAEPSKVPPKQG